MTKVLFVTGWLRSGTTVLGNSLASSPLVEHIGELHYLWGESDHPSGDECGCSRKLSDCPIWSYVLDEIGQGGLTPVEVNRIRLASWRIRKLLQRASDAHKGRSPAEYPALLGRVYKAVAEKSNSEVVVDSTKLPGDAMAALQASGVEVFVLHMVRDPRAVSYSSLRRKVHGVIGGGREMQRRSPASSSGQWLIFNAVIEGFIRPAARPGHFRTLRYEDFASNPERELRRICEWLAVDADTLKINDDGIELGISHTVMGNPNRFRDGLLKIVPDREWESQFTGASRNVSTLISSPLLRRYRYNSVARG